MIKYITIIALAFISQIAFAQGKINRDNRAQTTTQTSSVKPTVSGSVNSHDYVDLGLPSGNLWATCNIGASKPSDYGDYFAWAEISPKEEYSIFTCQSENWRFRDLINDFEKKTCIKAPVDQIIGNTLYDAAKAQWGNDWILPSKKDYEELISKCKWKKTTLNGAKGFIVTGSNGNRLFLPLAGYMHKAGPSQLKCEGEHGFYWTGDYNDSESNEHLSYAFCLSSPQYNKAVCPQIRYMGHSIRPIIHK